MALYSDIWYRSFDGLKLYARDYNSTDNIESLDWPVLLCLHGLTRNSADFEGICEQLCKTYRCIVVDQRGRGKSQYDINSDNYSLQVYVQDMFTLLEQLQLNNVVTIGTSMGGIISMQMAATNPKIIKALIINDIGPEIPISAMRRLQKYVGQLEPISSWEEAAMQTAEVNSIAFPMANKQDWHAFARRLYVENSDGNPTLAYDPNIRHAFADEYSEQVSDEDILVGDTWLVFDKIKDKPILSIRGELSDILSQQCQAKMQELKPDIQLANVSNVGHAPLLTEHQSITAINKFLKVI